MMRYEAQTGEGPGGPPFPSTVHTITIRYTNSHYLRLHWLLGSAVFYGIPVMVICLKY